MIFSLEILYIFKGFFKLIVSFSSNFNCWNIWTSVIRQHALCSDCILRHYPVNGDETVCSTLWDKTMVVNESPLLFLRLHILDSTPHLLTLNVSSSRDLSGGEEGRREVSRRWASNKMRCRHFWAQFKKMSIKSSVWHSCIICSLFGERLLLQFMISVVRQA